MNFLEGACDKVLSINCNEMSSFLGKIYAAIVLVVAGLERKRVTRSFTTDSLSLVVIVDHFSNLPFQ
jgi:hypothetical protein